MKGGASAPPFQFWALLSVDGVVEPAGTGADKVCKPIDVLDSRRKAGNEAVETLIRLDLIAKTVGNWPVIECRARPLRFFGRRFVDNREDFIGLGLPGKPPTG